ncbi:MAG: hypothetical protein ACPGES_08315 [Coraliomargarita sp.]
MRAFIIFLLFPCSLVLAHSGHHHKQPEQKHAKIENAELNQYASFIDSFGEITKLLEHQTRDAFSIPSEEVLVCHKYLVDGGAFRQKRVNGEVEIYISAQFGLEKTKRKNVRTDLDSYGVNYVATVSVRSGEVVIAKHEE